MSEGELVSMYVSCLSEPIEREKMVRPTWKGSQHRTNAKTITPGEGEGAVEQGGGKKHRFRTTESLIPEAMVVKDVPTTHQIQQPGQRPSLLSMMLLPLWRHGSSVGISSMCDKMSQSTVFNVYNIHYLMEFM